MKDILYDNLVKDEVEALITIEESHLVDGQSIYRGLIYDELGHVSGKLSTFEYIDGAVYDRNRPVVENISQQQQIDVVVPDAGAYKVGELVWEFPKTNHIRIKDSDGKIVYEKVLASSILLTDASQKIVIKDLVSYKLYSKSEATQILQEMILKLLNDRHPQDKEPEQEESIELIDTELSLDEVWEAVVKVGVTPRALLEVLMAVFISVGFKFSVPIWLILIGNPSSLKTELVKMFKGVKSKLLYLSTMSENAFASGYLPKDGSQPKDLLNHLDNKILLIRDLTTMFSLNEESIKKILGDLTSIFDGEFEKFTATRGLIKYKANFPFIGCITPAIMAKHHNYVQQLGSRFFFFRIPRLTGDERKQGFGIAWSSDDRKSNIEHAALLVSSYCAQVLKKIEIGLLPVIEDDVLQDWFNHASEFVARARGVAITKAETFTNKDGKSVNYYTPVDVQIEEPWRALNQLRNLAISLAAIHGKDKVGMEECEILKEVVRSTAPVDRAEVLNTLIDQAGLTVKDIASKIGKNPKTIQRQLKELEMLELVLKYHDPNIQSENTPWFYAIEPAFASLLEGGRQEAKIIPEFMSDEIIQSDLPF